MCSHAPIDRRNLTDPGVRELHRLLYVPAGLALGDRSRESTSAILSEDVDGEDPTLSRQRTQAGRSSFQDSRKALSRLRPAGPPPTQTTS